LWNEPRPELVGQQPENEPFFITRRFAERPKEGFPATATVALPDYHLLRPNAVAIPMRLRKGAQSSGPQASITFGHEEGITANLSTAAREYLASLTSADPDADEELSRAIWRHSLAVIYAPAYLKEHAAGIKQGWPRVPLPATLELLSKSAALGCEVAALLDPQSAFLGVTTGKLRRELALLGRITGPKSGLDLAITAGWGRVQKKTGIVMPGRGRIKVRDFSDEENAAIAEGAEELKMPADTIKALWGDKTVDVYFNNEVYWANVPVAAWNFKIGGYLVLKKWLSYRDKKVLGRDITKDEAREFTHMIRRLTALILIEPRLNTNYAALTDHIYPWPKSL
jgi:hypothetical protein